MVKRFLAVFFPAAEYLVTTRITQASSSTSFKTEGKVLVEPGWLAVYGKEAHDEDARATLVKVEPGRAACAPSRSRPWASQTKPPARYTEATLLSAPWKAPAS
ncbi:MAG: DNA topoisomerase [Comamonadaceae bacterium]|nr:DNA topoisomerase [Comamonadaceae bacterium]